MKNNNDKPRIFAFGDPHLSFSQNKPMDIFADKWKNHEAKIEAACRAALLEDDYLIIVGDISWALKFDDALPDLDWIDRLPGNKIIIKGNHDLWWHGIKRLNNLYENIHFLQNDYFMIDDSLAICGSRGWLLPGVDGYTTADDKITNRELIRLKLSLDSAMKAGAKEIICAMHFPPAVNPVNESVFTRLFAEYPITQVVYGHLHGRNSYSKGIMGNHNEILYSLVSIDYLDFKLFNIM